MKTKQFLLLAMLAAAAGNSAQAQVYRNVQSGRPYTFTASPTSGTGTITYQWFRNGQPILGANGQNYTIPDYAAQGASVEFRRGSESSDCPGNTLYTNVFIVSFCANSTLGAGGACWAAANVGAVRTFATRPDMYTPLYQWNRSTAYSATDPLSPAWNNTLDNSATWTTNPCPTGWRLPTQAEHQALHDAGSTWAAANSVRGNAVAGRFYGHNHATCTLPDNMNGCIFLPAVGNREPSAGQLNSQGSGGYYWSSQSVPQDNNSALSLIFTSGSSSSGTYNNYKAFAISLRCVQ